MKKIKNRLSAESDSNCFGCSVKNPKGLKLEFWEDGDEVVCFWDPEWYYDGWNGMVHGGIIATLCDETGEWLIWEKLNTVGVTTDLNVKYKKPLSSNSGQVEIRAKITRQIRNFVDTEISILDAQKNLCIEAKIRYYTYSHDIAVEKFGFQA